MLAVDSFKMKLALIFILGSFFAETGLSWTIHYTNKTMNWTQARKWCKDSGFTDMVVIQSQTENEQLVSKLATRKKSPYYWIGITKKHMDEPWMWIGNNSTWIGEHSWALNEPNNNHSTEFCVEIYVNTGANRGKWNDEKCANRKSPVCYKTQCSETSCERGRCQEMFENTTCLCDPGYEGDRCQTAVQCPALSGMKNGIMNCGDAANVSFIYGNTCNFSCAAGYSLVGAGSVTCTSAAEWSEKIPHCEAHPTSAVGCPPLPQPDNGYLSCSEGNQTLNSTCRFKCKSGFLMIGSPAITCGVAGVWSGPRPACTSYKRALLVVAGCGASSAFCCICLCWMKRRKRKKVTQERHHEEESPVSEA